jgi:hypothetical protein
MNTPQLRPVLGCLTHGSVSDPYGMLACGCRHDTELIEAIEDDGEVGDDA